MEKVIRNVWEPSSVPGLSRAEILRPDERPEGLGAERWRADRPVNASPRREAQLLSVLAGQIELSLDGARLRLPKGSHLYLPAGSVSSMEIEAGTELAMVWAPRPEQGRGRRVLLRDEQFVQACAAEGRALRWTLTPQYLSRRIFLHHDETLLSRSGHPISWFHTTMFDVSGLPPNDEGTSVFKMSYNSKTEFNLCYQVRGQAKVRMALHPYRGAGQSWGPWHDLDGDTTYHLNEAKGGPEEEQLPGPDGQLKPHRNKHEVSAIGGHVSLMCVFDPAPSGIERHRPGDYSDYEPIEQVLGTPEYEAHRRLLGPFDAMVDRLSWAKAKGQLEAERSSPEWSRFQAGRQSQQQLERVLVEGLDPERRAALGPWLLSD